MDEINPEDRVVISRVMLQEWIKKLDNSPSTVMSSISHFHWEERVASVHQQMKKMLE